MSLHVIIKFDNYAYKAVTKYAFPLVPPVSPPLLFKLIFLAQKEVQQFSSRVMLTLLKNVPALVKEDRRLCSKHMHDAAVLQMFQLGQAEQRTILLQRRTADGFFERSDKKKTHNTEGTHVTFGIKPRSQGQANLCLFRLVIELFKLVLPHFFNISLCKDLLNVA